MSVKCSYAECKRGCTTSCFVKDHRLYRPSNGTEGEGFTSSYCDNCIHQNPDPEAGKNCEILLSTLCYSPNEKEYPTQWHYDALGHPTCSDHVNWNWDDDGDPDDPDNPNKPPDPPDPRQLNLFPLYHPELHDNLVRTSI